MMTTSLSSRVKELEPPPWLYARLAAGGRFRRLYARLAADLAPRLPLGGRLLDVGTGPGGLPAVLACRRPDLTIVGLDLAPAMLRQGRKLLPPSPPCAAVALVAGDVHALPFPAAAFQAACATFSLHHWEHPLQGLREMTRVLAPGGVACLYELNGDAYPGQVRAFARAEGLPALLVWAAVRILGRRHGLSRARFVSLLDRTAAAHRELAPFHHIFWRCSLTAPN